MPAEPGPHGGESALFRLYRDATRPSPASVEAAVSAALLARRPVRWAGPPESPENRGRIPVAEEKPPTKSGASRGYPGSAEGFPRARGEKQGPVLGLAGIAAGILAVWAWRWEPSPEPLADPAPIAAGRSEPIEGVVLVASGSGTQRTGRTVAVLDWVVGEIDVEVMSGRGLGVTLHTADAEIRVIGTGFHVRRDGLGTEVTVRHGVVGVSCGGAAERRVEAGGTRLCVPITAAGLLGRARALEAAGAPAPEVRAAAELGLTAPDAAPAIRGELEIMRLRSLLGEHRAADALAAARAYLDGGYTDRRDEVLAVAISLADAAGECGAVLRWQAEAAAPAGTARCPAP